MKKFIDKNENGNDELTKARQWINTFAIVVIQFLRQNSVDCIKNGTRSNYRTYKRK